MRTACLKLERHDEVELPKLRVGTYSFEALSQGPGRAWFDLLKGCLPEGSFIIEDQFPGRAHRNPIGSSRVKARELLSQNAVRKTDEAVGVEVRQPGTRLLRSGKQPTEPLMLVL